MECDRHGYGAMAQQHALKIYLASISDRLSVHITFGSIRMRELCECSTQALRMLGQDDTDLLQRTLADLKAAKSFDELPPLYETRDSGNSCVEIVSEANFQLVVKVMKSEANEVQAKIIRLTINE